MAKPPDIVGLPLGVVVDALTLAWAALGAYVIWTTRSLTLAALALVTATAPAVVILILTPAAIRIWSESIWTFATTASRAPRSSSNRFGT